MATYAELYNQGLVPSGSRIILVVSQGPDPQGTQNLGAPTPDVLDKSQGPALESLSRAGYQTQVVYDYHQTVKKGLVAAQYPDAGDSSSHGNEAAIIISSGQAMSEKPMVKLTDVVGETEESAVHLLKDLGLSPQVMYEFNSAVPSGVVVAQLPGPRTYASAPPKRNVMSWLLIALLTIVLAFGLFYAGKATVDYVSSRRAIIAVPDLKGMSEEEARKAIEDAKFTVGDVEYGVVDDNMVGKVVYQDPQAGLGAAQGTKINLIIGIEGDDFEMPNLVGLKKEDAMAKAAALGIEVEIVEESSEEIEKGVVISHNPEAGTPMWRGDFVVITVSTGPKETEPEKPTDEDPADNPPADNQVTVPDVIGKNWRDAMQQLEGVGFIVDVFYEYNPSLDPDVVFRTSPEVGQKADKGSRISIFAATNTTPQP